MAIPVQIFNHTEQLYDTLLGQYKDKPIIRALLRTWTDQVQLIENDIYDLMLKTLFLTAEGQNLSRYGQLLGVLQPEGLPDIEYREQLILEIMRRSSNSTPDKIRQILEATTGMTGTRYFEHINGNQKPYTMGAMLIYGYSSNSSLFTLSGNSREAGFIRNSAPITSGSCILGVHGADPSSLFIPAELNQSPLTALGVSRNRTVNPTFDLDIEGWTVPSGVTYERLFTDISINGHHNGRMKVVSSNVRNIGQTIHNLNPTITYRVTVTQDAPANVTSRLTCHHTRGWDVLFENNGLIRVPAIPTPKGLKLQMKFMWRAPTDDGTTFFGLTRDLVVRDGKFIFDMTEIKVTLEGVPANTTDVLVTRNTWYTLQIEYIRQSDVLEWFGAFNSTTTRWWGYIRDISIVDAAGKEIHFYPVTAFQSAKPTGNFTMVDTVGGNNGTLEDITNWHNQAIELDSVNITGNATGFIEFSRVPSVTLSLLARATGVGTNTLYFDNFEMIALESLEQDTLVDQIGAEIAIRETGLVGGFGVGYQNAILAEFESRLESFNVETSLPNTTLPATPPSPYGQDPLNVFNEGLIQPFTIEFLDRFLDGSLKPRADKGVFLEIAQLNYDEQIDGV